MVRRRRDRAYSIVNVASRDYIQACAVSMTAHSASIDFHVELASEAGYVGRMIEPRLGACPPIAPPSDLLMDSLQWVVEGGSDTA